MEQIYTIPVNEAFEDCTAESRGESGAVCPFCLMKHRLEANEIDLILGASMMEPDTRIKTNEQGFCPDHFDKLLHGGKALPFALMMESHIEHIRHSLKGPGLMTGGNAATDIKTLETLGSSCYVCSRVDYHFTRMIDTAVFLWESEPEFVKKMEACDRFCYPHFAAFVRAAKDRLKGKDFSRFYKSVYGIMDSYTENLYNDVSFFCKKFDYRYADEPWGDAKDAPERASRLFCGEGVIEEKRDKKNGK